MNSMPVFLRAIPRSGGTLLVTMLDAHPEIAMSYEIYEENLFDEQHRPLLLDEIINWLDHTKENNRNDVDWIKRLPIDNFRVFLLRARRGGLSVTEILNILKHHACSNGSFQTSKDRLNFIDELMKKKMKKADKSIWGGKTQSNLYELHERYPNACFLIMNRDIRDVFASMLNNGSFTYTAEDAANLWKQRILDFREFIACCKAKGMEICYEELARSPESVLSKVCRLIGVSYDPCMLGFHEKTMTLFQNPHGHLSCEQLKKGLNTQSIGRWKNELSVGDLNSIRSVTGGLVNADAENNLP